MKKAEMIEEVIKRIKEAFPNSDVRSKMSKTNDNVWIIVNKKTYDKEDYQTFITKLSFDFIWKEHLHSVYFIWEEIK